MNQRHAIAVVVVLVIIIIIAVSQRRPCLKHLALPLVGGLIFGAVVLTGRESPIEYRGGKSENKSDDATTQFHGEYFTQRELNAIKEVSRHKQPISALPVVVGDLAALPYRPKPYQNRRSLHIGQRKLLLSEVDFLTDHGRPSMTVVYAGSAPGIHVPFLASLFPTLRFELYDPRRFYLRGGSADVLARIKIHQKYFTDKVAKTYAKRGDILFISDIRTGIPGTPQMETRVAADMDMQETWVNIISPQAAMLKFRLPYSQDQSVDYMQGDLRLQTWGPHSTTEVRLVVTPPFARVSYLPRDHENRMYYLSAILREWVFYEHGVSTDLVPGLDHCYDCAAEVRMWGRYLGDQSTGSIADLINQASKSLGRPLDAPPHGVQPHVLMIDKR